MADPQQALIATSIAVAFVHTIAGPDHYVPFAAMGRAGRWSMRRTLLVTAACGLGHVGGSIVLGLIGVAVGIGVESLNWLESARGDLAAWLFIALGIAYLSWGIWRGLRNRPHSHAHVHADGTVHAHTHIHDTAHMHVHREPQAAVDGAGDATGDPARDDAMAGGPPGPGRFAVRAILQNPWTLFVIFVFGPCEPLIPLIMYPAALHDTRGIWLVVLLFSAVTIATMLTAVAILHRGIALVRLPRLERYSHALAGGAVLACGLAIKLGL
jgi:nickel/cobalt exporter